MSNKYKKLTLSILLDLVGFIPFIDLLWAPLSGYIMTRMYTGNKGKVAGIISFVEEIIPFSDFIPTFTIMWFYTHVFNNEENKNDDIVIEV
ncbi:hypothetical protein [Polaribacter ponticola]|uniref:RDD domain-containing protein n=1 Tax=Polaribacter ponticola TaxID=2978475 RepID=A0ABT5S898_9FLAO|nr:hypothetical protein [Polaribacter sp. MSW5]MDD7914321.1 hypothetical protein [Polaribacter sp. MSW5]